MRAAAGGDRAAFAALYDRFARPVFVYLAARLDLREDAEDALQATFLTAWARLPGLRDPRLFPGWLFRIARSRAGDLGRRHAARPLPLQPGEDLIGPDGEADAALAEVKRAVAGLKPETRALVLLRVVEGLDAETVAEMLGVSASTVRRRYARALAHLKESLTTRGCHG